MFFSGTNAITAYKYFYNAITMFQQRNLPKETSICDYKLKEIYKRYFPIKKVFLI